MSCAGGGDPVESLSAVTLATVDMAASVAFYDALGFRLRYGGPEAEFTSLAVGPTSYLNLQLVPTAPAPGWGRVIIWIDDVDAMHDRAVAAGYTPEAAPVDAAWRERYFHIHDPSGHELSFARPLDA